MKILVDHGSSNNLGDMSMLEGALTKLSAILPGAHFHIIERPGMSTRFWGGSSMSRQRDYAVKPLWGDALRDLPFLWRYQHQWRLASTKLTLLALEAGLMAGRLSFSDKFRDENEKRLLRDLCRDFDALFIVGGGNLTDAFSTNLFRKCCMIEAFSELKKPVVLSGQQIGPFKSSIFEHSLRKTLRRVDFLGLRETGDSLRFCEGGEIAYTVMGDDSLGLIPADNSTLSTLMDRYGLKENSFLAINIRISHYAPEHSLHLKLVAHILEAMAKYFAMPLVLVPIALNDVDSDVAAGKRLSDSVSSADIIMLQERELTPAIAKGIAGLAFGTISVSYHLCTFSLSSGVPAICIYDGDYYAQKAKGLCEFWEEDDLQLPLKNLKAHTAISHMKKTLADDDMRRRLRERAITVSKMWNNVYETTIKDGLISCEV